MFSVVLKPLTLHSSLKFISTAFAGRNARCIALCLPVIGSLVACDGNYNDTVTGELSEGELSLNLPARIRNISAINPNAVRAIATVNNQQYPLTRANDGTYQTSITVNADSAVSVSVSFSETLPGGTAINLASHPAIERNTGSNDLTMQFFDNNYETANFDLDGDGCSNIVEREVETNPLVNDTLPANFERSVSFNIPASINSLPEQLLFRPIVTIGNIIRAATINQNNVQSTGRVPQCANAEIQVLLRITINGNSLVVAQASVPHGTSVNNVLSESDFNFNEDADGDGLTNLTEIQNGTDPFVRN